MVDSFSICRWCYYGHSGNRDLSKHQKQNGELGGLITMRGWCCFDKIPGLDKFPEKFQCDHFCLKDDLEKTLINLNIELHWALYLQSLGLKYTGL